MIALKKDADAVQQLLDYNIQWHLAAPAAVIKVLNDTFRR